MRAEECKVVSVAWSRGRGIRHLLHSSSCSWVLLHKGQSLHAGYEPEEETTVQEKAQEEKRHDKQ